MDSMLLADILPLTVAVSTWLALVLLLLVVEVSRRVATSRRRTERVVLLEVSNHRSVV